VHRVEDSIIGQDGEKSASRIFGLFDRALNRARYVFPVGKVAVQQVEQDNGRPALDSGLIGLLVRG
jgi:hypothetical protein